MMETYGGKPVSERVSGVIKIPYHVLRSAATETCCSIGGTAYGLQVRLNLATSDSMDMVATGIDRRGG